MKKLGEHSSHRETHKTRDIYQDLWRGRNLTIFSGHWSHLSCSLFACYRMMVGIDVWICLYWFFHNNNCFSWSVCVLTSWMLVKIHYILKNEKRNQLKVVELIFSGIFVKWVRGHPWIPSRWKVGNTVTFYEKCILPVVTSRFPNTCHVWAWRSSSKRATT